MFNIHTTELILVAIVALIVIGPEKLPGTIRTASLWIGRFRRSFYRVKADIEREINADEIRRQLHNESVMAEIEEAKDKVQSAADQTRDSVNKIVSSDNFDPGASEQTALQQAEQQIDEARQEIAEVSEEIKDAGRQLYGSGINPKLASADNNASSEEENSETGNSGKGVSDKESSDQESSAKEDKQ